MRAKHLLNHIFNLVNGVELSQSKYYIFSAFGKYIFIKTFFCIGIFFHGNVCWTSLRIGHVLPCLRSRLVPSSRAESVGDVQRQEVSCGRKCPRIGLRLDLVFGWDCLVAVTPTNSNKYFLNCISVISLDISSIAYSTQ